MILVRYKNAGAGACGYIINCGKIRKNLLAIKAEKAQEQDPNSNHIAKKVTSAWSLQQQ